MCMVAQHLIKDVLPLHLQHFQDIQYRRMNVWKTFIYVSLLVIIMVPCIYCHEQSLVLMSIDNRHVWPYTCNDKSYTHTHTQIYSYIDYIVIYQNCELHNFKELKYTCFCLARSHCFLSFFFDFLCIRVPHPLVWVCDIPPHNICCHSNLIILYISGYFTAVHFCLLL